MRLSAFPITAALLATTACGVRVAATPLTPGAAYAPVPADSVRLFVTRAPARYTELALLKADGFFPQRDAKRLRALRERAGQLGANGLLLLGTQAPASVDVSGVVVGGPASGSVLVGQAGGAEDETRAVAIRYDPTVPMVAPGARVGGAAARQ